MKATLIKASDGMSIEMEYNAANQQEREESARLMEAFTKAAGGLRITASAFVPTEPERFARTTAAAETVKRKYCPSCGARMEEYYDRH